MKFIYILLFFIAPVFGENPQAINTFLFQTGYSYPFYGHWGDKDAGFKKASDYKFMYIRDIDENISYGIQTGYFYKYENKGTDLNIRFFSFTPLIFSWLGTLERKYFFFLASGIYQISQPKSLQYASDSITEFGFSIGTGVLYNFFFQMKWGISIQWHHIFNMKGDNFDLDSANNLDINLNLAKRF